MRGGGMKKHIYNDIQLVEIVEAKPVCGLDFCDSCGDCLACYGGDPCWDTYPVYGEHYWIEYLESEQTMKKTRLEQEGQANVI
jgi:hypothetical protein